MLLQRTQIGLLRMVVQQLWQTQPVTRKAAGKLVCCLPRLSQCLTIKNPVFSYSTRAPRLEDSIKVKFVKSSGPGGQSVNKLNSKAEVRLNIQEADWIPYDVRQKLLQQEKNRINKDGVLVVTSEKFRIQSRNLKDALDKIRGMIVEASYVPEAPSADQVKKVLAIVEKENEKRLHEKKHQSEKKKNRFMD